MMPESFEQDRHNFKEMERMNDEIGTVEIDNTVNADSSMASDSQSRSLVTVETRVLEGRKRQLSASITVPQSVENTWKVLTDYDGLADFIPSLKESRRIESQGKSIRIEQIGSQSLLKIKFCARVVLDMVESFPHRIDFNMVEGDFKEFYGAWLLKPTEHDDIPFTELTYTADILPSRLMPVSIIEKKLSHNLQINLEAIYNRVNELFGSVD
jgi:ribosome-associated toxin RatA of RatAB toxin-antitoxin module